MILIPKPQHGQEINQIDSMYPTKMIPIQDNFVIDQTIGNMYGFCTKGTFTLHAEESWTVNEDDFFTIKTPLDNDTEITME